MRLPLARIPLFVVITRLVRVIHVSEPAAAWIARTSRAMTVELGLVLTLPTIRDVIPAKAGTSVFLLCIPKRRSPLSRE